MLRVISTVQTLSKIYFMQWCFGILIKPEAWQPFAGGVVPRVNFHLPLALQIRLCGL